MIELIRQKRLKDRFKREFGASIDDFMDEPVTPEQKPEPVGAGVVGDEELIIENEEGDEELLDKLLKANEAIDSLEQEKVVSELNPLQARKPNQDELLRQ